MFIYLKHLKATLVEIVTLTFKSIDEIVILQIKPFGGSLAWYLYFLGFRKKEFEFSVNFSVCYYWEWKG